MDACWAGGPAGDAGNTAACATVSVRANSPATARHHVIAIATKKRNPRRLVRLLTGMPPVTLVSYAARPGPCLDGTLSTSERVSGAPAQGCAYCLPANFISVSAKFIP